MAERKTQTPPLLLGCYCYNPAFLHDTLQQTSRIPITGIPLCLHPYSLLFIRAATLRTEVVTHIQLGGSYYLLGFLGRNSSLTGAHSRVLEQNDAFLVGGYYHARSGAGGLIVLLPPNRPDVPNAIGYHHDLIVPSLQA